MRQTSRSVAEWLVLAATVMLCATLPCFSQPVHTYTRTHTGVYLQAAGTHVPSLISPDAKCLVRLHSHGLTCQSLLTPSAEPPGPAGTTSPTEPLAPPGRTPTRAKRFHDAAYLACGAFSGDSSALACWQVIAASVEPMQIRLSTFRHALVIQDSTSHVSLYLYE